MNRLFSKQVQAQSRVRTYPHAHRHVHTHTQTHTRAQIHTHTHFHPHSRAPRGFILPTVLIATLLVAALTATLQAAVWRSTRNARLGFAGERALHGADAAVAAQLSQWDARAFASMPVGARTSFAPVLPNALNATVTLVRTSIGSAVVEAVATSTQNGVLFDTERRVTRMLTVRNAPLALEHPLTVLGNATFANPATVSTMDETPPGWNAECATGDSIDAPNAVVSNPVALRALFDAHWHQWLAVASRVDVAASVTALAPTVTGALCVPGTGDPWRGVGSVSACTNEWGARSVSSAAPLLLTSPSRHQGVLVIDGDLTLTGDLEVYGLLMVRGAVDASAGRLLVRGAALVRDDLGHGSRFGFATRVRYSRCALRRALSATGAPAAITTRGWMERF